MVKMTFHLHFCNDFFIFPPKLVPPLSLVLLFSFLFPIHTLLNPTEPWKGKLITFSKTPEFHVLEGETLIEKTQFIKRMEWGCNTDFQKVFDKILEVAMKGNLSEEQMIKRLFVFSDMEFDVATTRPWETDYNVIQRKFEENGYNNVPEIVFGNLRDSKATPVPSNEKGVALVSGFSKNLVSLFLEEGGILSPESVMMKAISGEEYEKLLVFD